MSRCAHAAHARAPDELRHAAQESLDPGTTEKRLTVSTTQTEHIVSLARQTEVMGTGLHERYLPTGAAALPCGTVE